MARTVHQVAFDHIDDIKADAKVDGQKLTELVHLCIVKAKDALDVFPGQYDELERETVKTLLDSLRSTHHNLRILLAPAESDARSIDAMTLARSQLELLYVISLMVESKQYVTRYLQEGWAKQYLRFLLRREECKNLPRHAEFLQFAPGWFQAMRDFLGLTTEQQLTLEHRQLGVPQPAGFKTQDIPTFPTPGSAINKITDLNRKKMLERLYLEYVHLCSFSHGLAEANLLKGILKAAPTFGQIFSPAQVSDMFEKAVSSPAFLISILSMLQCAAEVSTLYPADIELRASLIGAWNVLVDADLLSQAIWHIRTKALLGVIATLPSAAPLVVLSPAQPTP